MIRKFPADTPESDWFKSSHSDGPDGNSCVEIALTPASVHVRDSKAPQGPRLTVDARAWAAFLTLAGRD
ncbi:DUF397 domain-containing protein [Streptomyces sp. NBC_00820]|uniref:DUF397 domain-containing protein n=1 Tax=Streptomyces sp. NBC_00820 TaxID=2975842 RepID=UPI002ED3FDEB|nr:DUF397 domain-containing protein [Streptomyces sp. NBC_00820]